MNDEKSMKPKTPLAFEQAFDRLEEILEKLNSGEISLDESLKLYEEADKLIRICHQHLTDAENRIEILVKNRQGELIMENDQKPLTQSFNLSNNDKNS